MGRAYQNRKESMAKTSDQKARVYSRYAREIYVSAKAGGLDPSGNLELRSLMERAKKEQVPSHVIDKAIDKAEGGGGEDFARAVYEGYGPAGSMAIIECLTDNPNRTFGDVRQAFTKTKTKIGTPGSVAHMFDHTAILAFKSDDEEGALEALMMADVDVTDIENEEGIITVFAPPNEYAKAKKSLLEAFGELDFEMDEIQYVPQATLKLEGEELELFNKFVDMLDYLEDVQNVYHNIDL